jgi:poly(A) polymerase
VAEPVAVVPRTPDLDDVLEALRGGVAELGLEAYLVGGFVRDRLRGLPLAEVKDIDLLVVGADGTEVLRRLARQLGWAPPQRFERFGTAQVRGDGFVVEVVQARAERYDPASRKPDVRPGTLDEDIWRRDFTVNALCQTLEGHLLDRTGRGIDDLRAGILRTPLEPRETLSEDPLRMYRAARFAAQLGFDPAAGLLEAMRSEAHRADILGPARVLSVERVAEELRRLLVSPHPRKGMEVLRDSGLLAVSVPELQAMVGVEQSGFHRYDVFDHTTHALDASSPDLLTRLGVLFHDVGKPPCHAVAEDGRHTFHDHPAVGAEMATAILERLRFSSDEIRDTAALVRLHLRPIQYRAEEFSDSAVRRLIRDAGPLRARLLDVARADTVASAFPDVVALDELEERMARLDKGETLSRRRPPLDGNTLIALAGRPPGPWVGRVQRALEEAVIDGAIEPGDAEGARRWLESRRGLLHGD